MNDNISGIRSDGNILPLPVMSTEKVVTEDGDVLVVEVTPSFDMPVRYRGRTFIRMGPRRDIASAEEERILAERCATSLPTFDTRPCRDATLDDIDTEVIIKEYMPKAKASCSCCAFTPPPFKGRGGSVTNGCLGYSYSCNESLTPPLHGRGVAAPTFNRISRLSRKNGVCGFM